MNDMQKRAAAAGCVAALLAVAVIKAANTQTENRADERKAPETDTETASADFAGNRKPDLIFWYGDMGYEKFFERAAKEYYEDTGKVVSVRYRDSFDYLNDVYQATMQEQEQPDVYLLGSDELEEAYLYGLAAENTARDIYADCVAAKAVEASTYREKMYGYPLSYNTCIFAYRNGYFENQPESVQSIIDYAIDNDPPENVQYLLEWDVNDPFYDFPFVSNSVSFEKKEVANMAISYDEEMYNADLEYFAQILESFSMDAQRVSEERVLQDFRDGTTLCAILDSDTVAQLKGVDCTITGMLPLNETLEAYSAAQTELVLVNDFSEKKTEAADFAEYLTLTMSEELHALGGHYSVKLGENADATERMLYEAYENSILVPDSQDAKEFWVTLKETISHYF